MLTADEEAVAVQPRTAAPAKAGEVRALPLPPRLRLLVLTAALLLLPASFILPGISRGEFHYGDDEGFHAFTGVYFADLLRDFPWRHPVQYTYEYYAQYPALGIVHWPPLFHVTEGIAFLAFGRSVVVARLTILAFALFGLHYWFRLIREIDDELTAVITTVVLAGVPYLLLFEKTVMLEVPSLAFCFAAMYYWVRYLETQHARSAYAFGLMLGLALLTKQQSIFLFPACFLTLVAAGKWRMLVRRPTIAAGIICLLLSSPFYILSLVVDGASIRGNVQQGIETVRHPLAYYPVNLPPALGPVLLVLSLLGLLTWLWWRRSGSSPMMLAYAGGWYATFTILATKTPRYIVYWLPAFVYLAVAPLTSRAIPRKLRWVTVPLALLLAVAGSWSAWCYRRPYVSGFAKVARDLARTANGGVVLFDGDLSANFVFQMRDNDPGRRFVVLRKALYATQVMAEFGAVELVHTPAEITTILRQYGVEYVIVEDNAPLHFHSQRLLRDLLRSDRFRLVEEVPVESNVPELVQERLRVYQYLDAGAPTEPLLRLKMLSTGHDIVVPLHALTKR